MSQLVDLVHKLEDEYMRNGKVSFLYVPDDQYKKFVKQRKVLERQHAEKKNSRWAKYSRSKVYRQAINDFLSRTQTANYTVKELTEMIDSYPVLSDHGRHIHEEQAVYALLNQHGLPWKGKRESTRKPRIRREAERCGS